MDASEVQEQARGCCKPVTSSISAMTASHLWKPCRRRRHLMVVLLVCVLLLAAYLAWTNVSGHVTGHPLGDFRQSQVDWESARAIRHRALSLHDITRGPREPREVGTFNDRLHHHSDRTVHGSSNTIRLLGNSSSVKPQRTSQSSQSDDNFQSDSVALNARIKRVTQMNEEQRNAAVRHDHADDDQLPPAAADDADFSHRNNRRRSRRRRKFHDPVAVESDLLSGSYSGSRERQPHESTASSRILHSVSSKTAATPKPIFLVVGDEEEEAESDIFKEPDVVIRSAEADMPRHARLKAANASGAVDSKYGPGGSKRSPLLGDLHGGPGSCHVYDARDELPELVDFAAGVDCFDLATTPSVVVCPYPDTDDRHLSQPLRTHGVWEPHIVRLFQAALLTDSQLGVYDVGANVGQYALLAAAMGRRVVAVEPYRPNIYRLHKAIRLGRFEDKVYDDNVDKSLL